ncbi:MAG: outer membrane beta-barrel protein [Flavobacteriales bacterium]
MDSRISQKYPLTYFRNVFQNLRAGYTKIFSPKLDYSYALGEQVKLFIGITYSHMNVDNSFDYEYLLGETFIKDFERS